VANPSIVFKRGEFSDMAPAAPLSDPAKAVLDYHRTMPNNDPRFAFCLIGNNPINSLADLDAAYAELLEARIVEAVATGWAIDEKTGHKVAFRSFYQCRPPISVQCSSSRCYKGATE